MKNTYIKTITIAVVAIIVCSALPLSRAQDQTQDYTASFQLLNHPDGDATYQLNVTIPQVLYEYYMSKNHALFTADDFPKFVTPYTLKPIADRLWQIYNNTEDFTNGVLMLVHQITYQEVVPGKYPVETLVSGYGDCDLFSYIAASILEAGGINVVLLYYKEQLHMEIGVDLASAPVNGRVNVCSVNYQNVSYYIGECTGTNWRDGWRVGECPTEFQNVSAQVVTLEGMEQTSFGQVSANLKELDASTLTLQVSPTLTLENNQIKITGQILPETANQNITLQAKINTPTWTTVGTVLTQANGRFEYTWTPQTSGSITIQASWLGNRQYNGAKSVEADVTILPMLMIALIGTTVLAVSILVFTFLRVRRKKHEPTVPTAEQNTSPADMPPPPPNLTPNPT